MTQTEQYRYCGICPIIENPDQVNVAARLFEGEYWRATLRVGNQALLGTTYITLKEHKPGVELLTPDEENEFSTIRNGLIVATRRAFGATIPNISTLMNHAYRNNGDPNFQPQPHVHTHFKPRHDGPRVVGGVEFTDPEFGSYLQLSRGQAVSPEIATLICGAMRDELRAEGL